MKSCTVCNETKELDSFFNHPNTVDKKGSRCKSCEASEKRKSRVLAKQQLVDYKGGKCEICGYSKCIDALDFHHNNGEKNFQISGGNRGMSMEKLKKEADSCMLLCANCHREVHALL